MFRGRLARALMVLAGFAMCWVILVMWTGGGAWSLGGVRISTRGTRNPALLAVLSLVLSWAIGPSGRRLQQLAGDYRWLVDLVVRRSRRIRVPAPLIAAITAAFAVIVGATQGAWLVGGSDSYGYVSQAQLWTIGALRLQPQLFRPLSDVVPIQVMTPLGYRPTIDGETIAPSYPPGLPIVMAGFERLAGRDGVFWVIPIFAAVLVMATYLLGARVYGPRAGAVAAVFVAASPPVLVQLTAAPMSDLPAAAWWTLALVFTTFDRRSAAMAAGAAAAMAILTRPNLVPLAAVMAGLLVWRLSAAGRARREVIQRAALFALPIVPACLAIAAMNRVLWGSALQSGHGSLAELFSVSNVWHNVLLYPRVIAVQMPVTVLLPIAWLLRKRAPRWGVNAASDRTLLAALGVFALAVVLCYLAYPPYDSERNLRFLLPALPAVVVLACVAAFRLAGRVVEQHAVACVLAVAALGGFGMYTARGLGTFDMEHLGRYPVAGNYIARQLPERAVLLAMLHSGSATYYSGRPTLRYDLIPPSELDAIVTLLHERGYVPYLLLDSDERHVFQERYRGHSRLAALDWKPLVSLHSPAVEIYATAPVLLR